LKKNYSVIIISPPGTIVWEGLMFYCCLLLFFNAAFPRSSADRREMLPHDRKHVQCYNPDPKVWGRGAAPKKLGGQKHA